MMLKFLNNYSHAVNLDDARFGSLFRAGVRKSDFLLFEESTVCEFKEIRAFDVAKRVEHLAKKTPTSEQNFKRDLYNTISNALSSANKQIKDTKDALDTPESLGLIIVENLIPEDMSVLTLMDAADRKMLNGLEFVDGVLCLDFANTFIDANGSHIQPVQIVTRDSERSKRLYHLVWELLRDFGSSRSTPVYDGLTISKADQKWITDADGRYRGFVGTFNIKGDVLKFPQDR